MQVLRADLVAHDPQSAVNVQEPRRSLLKPEMVWQLDKGFSQTPEQVYQCHHITKAISKTCMHNQRLDLW